MVESVPIGETVWPGPSVIRVKNRINDYRPLSDDFIGIAQFHPEDPFPGSQGSGNVRIEHGERLVVGIWEAQCGLSLVRGDAQSGVHVELVGEQLVPWSDAQAAAFEYPVAAVGLRCGDTAGRGLVDHVFVVLLETPSVEKADYVQSVFSLDTVAGGGGKLPAGEGEPGIVFLPDGAGSDVELGFAVKLSYDGSTLTVELPDVQNGREGTFDSNLFISIAKSSGSDLFFYNLCGGVEFSVDEPEVKSVTLKGNNGETLAGKVKVLLDGDNKPYVSEVIDGKTEITLTAPGGKYFEKDKLYYIVALPAVLEKGFTLTFKKQPGGAVRVSEKTVEVKRSIWGTLYRADKGVKYDRPIEFADPEVQRVCLANWDSDGDGYFLESEAEAVTSFGTAFKGSAIRSFYEISYFTAVQGLEDEAFAGCSSLAAFVIPDNITFIGGRVFEDCPSLSFILADKDNINFKTVDGILYNAGMTELVRYPQAKSGRRYVLPETVANIVPGALQGCSSLQAVFISHPAPPVCQDMTFGDSPEVIYVLDSALDNYRTWEVWNRWSSKYIGLAADEIHFIDFKDTVFETYMLGSYDANGDGIISYKEVKGIVELNLVGMGLSSIDGLALMPDLERLDIRNNPNVKSIDLSGNPKLHYIDVSGTGIREFDISKCCYKFDYIGGLSGTCKALVISGQYAMNNYKSSNMKAVVDGSAFTTEDWSRDGEVVTLQNHTRGPGLSLLLMGDGYIDQDIESGLFDRQMRLTYNALFSVEPYITLKDYFDVYYKITLSGSRVFDGNTYWAVLRGNQDSGRIYLRPRQPGPNPDFPSE